MKTGATFGPSRTISNGNQPNDTHDIKPALNYANEKLPTNKEILPMVCIVLKGRGVQGEGVTGEP